MFLLQKNIVVALLAVLLIKMMAIPLVCLQYQLNKDFIAANLCENKAKPQMQCEGKCHLKKQIEKNSDTPNPSGEKSNVKISLSEFFLENNTHTFDIAAGTCTFAPGHYSNTYAHLYFSSIFHPPLTA